jgi:hypothetical protein
VAAGAFGLFGARHLAFVEPEPELTAGRSWLEIPDELLPDVPLHLRSPEQRSRCTLGDDGASYALCCRCFYRAEREGCVANQWSRLFEMTTSCCSSSVQAGGVVLHRAGHVPPAPGAAFVDRAADAASADTPRPCQFSGVLR